MTPLLVADHVLGAVLWPTLERRLDAREALEQWAREFAPPPHEQRTMPA